MKWKKACVGLPSASVNRLRPVSAESTDWCTCIAEPGSWAIGLAMKVA